MNRILNKINFILNFPIPFIGGIFIQDLYTIKLWKLIVEIVMVGLLSLYLYIDDSWRSGIVFIAVLFPIYIILTIYILREY